MVIYTTQTYNVYGSPLLNDTEADKLYNYVLHLPHPGLDWVDILVKWEEPWESDPGDENRCKWRGSSPDKVLHEVKPVAHSKLITPLQAGKKPYVHAPLLKYRGGTVCNPKGNPILIRDGKPDFNLGRQPAKRPLGHQYTPGKKRRVLVDTTKL